MTKYLRSSFKEAHKHCAANRKELEQSKKCCCFYCFEIYDPREILEDPNSLWDRKDTAFCSRCGIDSVIGDASGYPINDPIFVEIMGFIWFNGYARGHDPKKDYSDLYVELEKYVDFDIEEDL